MRISKKLLIVLSAVPLLASCGGVKWKNYSYKRVLSGEEKETLVHKVLAATTPKLKRVVENYYSLSQNALRKEEITQKTQTDVFKKGETFDKFSSEDRLEEKGLVKKAKRTRESYFALFDEANHKFARVDKNNNANLVETYAYSESVVLDAENEAATGAMSGVIDLIVGTGPGELKAVEKENGENFFLYSNTDETYETVNYGKESKVAHTRTRTQYVVLLNKDLTIKTCTKFDSVEKNRDSATNEFYKKLKLENKTTVEYLFTYGDREAAPESFAEIRKTAKSGYQLGALTFKAIGYDKDGNELNTITFNNLDSRRLSFSKKYVSFHRYAMPATYLATKVASYKFKLFGSSISNAKADPVGIDVQVKLGSLSAGNSLASLSGGGLKMGSQAVTLDVECDVEATSKGAKVSNVNAFASSNVFES